jgi:ABC-type nitrate/sulfonate/bicarbonate transport system substrate-binding protein
MVNSSRASFLAALAAASASAAPRPARAQTLVPLRIAGVSSDAFAEPYYAKSAGAFAKGGFDVNVINMSNAAAVAAAIGSGSLEMGTGDLVSGVNAILAGVPIAMIAGAALYRAEADANSSILAVIPSAPIHGPADLAGKTIGVPTLVGLTTACLRSWLNANGVPESSVKLVEIPTSSALPALQRGTLDVALLAEPFVTFAKGQVRSVGSPFNSIAEKSRRKAFCISVWYASKPWIDQDPSRAKRAVDAIYATAAWANSHQNETFKILVDTGKLDADKARGMLRSTFATALTPELIEPILDVAQENKLFQKRVQADVLITKV